MAITSTFLPGAGILTTFGDDLNNTITLSRDAAGKILVNGGAVSVKGGTPTVANTSLIQVFGQAGNDTIALDESNGALPAANLFGGAGNDTLIGGSGDDQLFGQSGDDTLLGKGGNDFLFGGSGNDTLAGGDGNDQVFGQAGNDLMIWNPGDDSDLFEGGDGIDTAQVNGGNGSETFTITANGTRVRFDRIDPAPFTIDIGTTENLVLNANGGDDVITAGNGLSTLIKLTIDGGAGNDTITGGDGNDLLLGGDGNDTITGGRGNDTALLGDGDDTFIWNPGDGSDTVEGQAGSDTLLFNGANINEAIDISVNGERARFTRDVANITMDVNGVEIIHFNALGGADKITVDDLSGTAVKEAQIDLAGTLGGTAGDGQVDTVTVNGTGGNDVVDATGSSGSVTVAGLPATVSVTHAEAGDQLVIRTLAGNDTISAATLAADTMQLSIDGGAGDDTIIGSQGADTLLGGDGNDIVTGGRGNDIAFLGAGDDTFIWNPGDGSDTVEGQDGTDTLVFNGANIAENFEISANGARALLTRDVGNVTMDLNGIETINIATLGGADKLTVNDLTGANVTKVNIDVAATGGGGDGQADTVLVNATNADNTITIASSNDGTFTVHGLAADVVVQHAEPTDQLVINALGGNDLVDASNVAAGQAQLTINAGAGNDTVIGGAGDDLIVGGTGNDLALMGAGDDTFVWNPGDGSDTVEGQAGADTLVFNGANVNETMTLSANGERALLTRDVGAVTMDMKGVENVDINARGGSDTITVNDMTGTDVTQVHIDLAGTTGGTAGDNQPDTVVINGTAGDDVIQVSLENGVLVVSGLAAEVVIDHFDFSDTVRIVGLAGDDVIVASGVGPDGPQLMFEGQDGNDILIGGAGNDTLDGGAGDDILIGGPGQDVLLGGPGDNILIQDGFTFAVATNSTDPSHPEFFLLS